MDQQTGIRLISTEWLAGVSYVRPTDRTFLMAARSLFLAASFSSPSQNLVSTPRLRAQDLHLNAMHR